MENPSIVDVRAICGKSVTEPEQLLRTGPNVVVGGRRTNPILIDSEVVGRSVLRGNDEETRNSASGQRVPPARFAWPVDHLDRDADDCSCPVRQWDH